MAEMNAQHNMDHLYAELRSLKGGIIALLKRLRGMKGIRGLRKKLRDQRRQINQFLHLDDVQRLHEALPSLKKALLQLLLQLKILQSIHGAVSSLNQKVEGVVESLNNSSNVPVRRTLRENEDIEPLNKALKENGCEDVVGLLQEGEHVDIKDSQGNTRLLKSAEEDSAQCVKVLIDHKADVHAKNNLGEEALHKAAYKGRPDTVKVLLEAGADVNRVDNEGETAFHEAAYCRKADWSGKGREKYQAIAEMLRVKKVDRSIRNKEGDTAADIARRKCLSLVDKFVEQGGSMRHRHSLALEREEETVTIFPESVKSVEGRAVPGITHMDMQAGNNNAVSRLGTDSLVYTGMLMASWFGLFKGQSFKPETSSPGLYKEMNHAEQHLREGKAKYGSKFIR